MFKLAPESASFNLASSVIASAISFLVKKQGLDVFEIEESFGWSSATSRLKLLPVVVRLHGPWFLNGLFDDPDVRKAVNRRRIKSEGRAIQSAQFVTAPCAEVLRAVQNHYGFNLTASLVIPNPFDAAAAAEIWDVNTSNIKSLLFVGRFDAHKGGDLVLRAFVELAAKDPGLRLKFVGPDNGIELTHGGTYSFEQFVRSILPRSRWPCIEFCGSASHFDVMSLRREHFVTIIASRYEIMPYSVLEAMSLGCPIVATAVGGIPELITDNRNGILVSPDDVRALTEGCKRLLYDKGLAARLGRQAWQDCRELYSPHNIAKQTATAYMQAIEEFKLRTQNGLGPVPSASG
jgi:glycosyltransferase involved in cell wall biosynthesis